VGRDLSGLLVNKPIARGADKAKGGIGGHAPFGLDKRYFESLLLIAVETGFCYPPIWFCQFAFANIYI